jgi:lysyl-tRNA synthetase, class II
MPQLSRKIEKCQEESVFGAGPKRAAAMLAGLARFANLAQSPSVLHPPGVLQLTHPAFRLEFSLFLIGIMEILRGPKKRDRQLEEAEPVTDDLGVLKTKAPQLVSSTPDTFEASRLEKLHRIEALGVDPWGQRFDGHEPIGSIVALTGEQDPRPRVCAAGRVVQRRGQGKVYFIDIKDWTGRVQVMLGAKQIGETGWGIAQELDLGDLVGVRGEFGKTKMGEKTIFASELTFLGKSLQPHPDKWAGMQEIEFRLRHRYLDLIYTPETLERTLKRIKIIARIRSFLNERGFCEVETPTLHTIAGGAAAKPFITHHNTLDIDLVLRIALELHLKRLLVGGLEKVYEIGRVFRNEGISPRHNPEFTMMELYQAYADYRSMMDLTEGMIVACVETLGGGMKLAYGDKEIDFSPPWKRARYGDLFREHVGVAMDDVEGLRRAAEATGFPAAGKHPDVIVHHLFETKVEEHLAGPVFVHDYPASLCPLTKRKRDNPAIAERFELYIHGMELANAYTELNDPVTQEATFKQQLAGLPEEESMAKMDEDFVRALRHGMPPAGGLGVGIDRLVMLLTNTQTIRDVILFPLLRPEKK